MGKTIRSYIHIIPVFCALFGLTAAAATASRYGVAPSYRRRPVTVSISPAAVTLTASQIQTFQATVSGSRNTAVTWSLSAPVGTISSTGIYTAPSTISATTTVTVQATSVAYPSIFAQATVTLTPPAAVSITVSPGSVTLAASQTQQFTAWVSGSSNTAVTWSLSAAVGSISASGLYTAPAAVSASQTVTVTATAAADPTQSAQAVVTLNPPLVSITVSPGSVTLNDSQSEQFTATVTGSNNTGVTWSLSSPLGSLSSTGLYTAPTPIGATQTITVTATAAADTTKTASVAINLAPQIGLTWTASVSSGLAGYNVYRSTITGGPYVRINAAPVAVTSFNDPNVQKGTYYYYVSTAVTPSGQESTYSTEVQVLEP